MVLVNVLSTTSGRLPLLLNQGQKPLALGKSSCPELPSDHDIIAVKAVWHLNSPQARNTLLNPAKPTLTVD